MKKNKCKLDIKNALIESNYFKTKSEKTQKTVFENAKVLIKDDKKTLWKIFRKNKR